MDQLEDDEPEDRPVPQGDRIWPVISCWSNPTETYDQLNAALPQELQYPGSDYRGRLPGADGPDLDPDGTIHLQPEYVLIRCYRSKHPRLPDAQRFFNNKRIDLNWKAEGAIFRTARYWCKRTYS